MDMMKTMPDRIERILDALKASPEGLSGAQLSIRTHLSSGTLYPLLFQMENTGTILSGWEQRYHVEGGRPRRRIYTLAGKGPHSVEELK